MTSTPTDAGSPTEILARYASALGYADLPHALRSHLKLLALDAFGCCLHGASLPWTTRVRAQVAAQGGRPEAAILGSPLRVPALRRRQVEKLEEMIGTMEALDDVSVIARACQADA